MSCDRDRVNAVVRTDPGFRTPVTGETWLSPPSASQTEKCRILGCKGKYRVDISSIGACERAGNWLLRPLGNCHTTRRDSRVDSILLGDTWADQQWVCLRSQVLMHNLVSIQSRGPNNATAQF